MNKLINKYNSPDTVGIISSFPQNGGEIAVANAISRYSYLLSKSFPKNQKLIIFCEKRQDNEEIYELTKNMLVIPSYRAYPVWFLVDLVKSLTMFNRIKDYLIQFEFSTFGGKKVVPQVMLLISYLRLFGKNTSITLHQVVTNINELSGHLGLKRGSVKSSFLNFSMKIFNIWVGLFANKVVVHDSLLKNRLKDWIKEDKIAVIPHAVGDLRAKRVNDYQKQIARKEYGLKKDDTVLTVFGYRSWYKGTDWIVKTIKNIADANPRKNIKLLVAGGVSPTLKNTASYKCFDRRLKNIIKEANGAVKVTDFIPENEVWKVFAVSDVMVFPYRTRMSASGAFSLSLAYKKPFIASDKFAEGLGLDVHEAVFSLNSYAFEKALENILHKKYVNKKLLLWSREYTKNSDWESVANLYLSEIKTNRFYIPKISFLPRLALTK